MEEISQPTQGDRISMMNPATEDVIFKFNTSITVSTSKKDNFGDFYVATAFGFKDCYARTPDRALAFMLHHMYTVYLERGKNA